MNDVDYKIKKFILICLAGFALTIGGFFLISIFVGSIQLFTEKLFNVLVEPIIKTLPKGLLEIIYFVVVFILGGYFLFVPCFIFWSAFASLRKDKQEKKKEPLSSSDKRVYNLIIGSYILACIFCVLGQIFQSPMFDNIFLILMIPLIPFAIVFFSVYIFALCAGLYLVGKKILNALYNVKQ